MKHFKSILFTACVVRVDAPWGCEGAMDPPYNNSVDAIDCTDAFNAARTAVGLAPFNKCSRPILSQDLEDAYRHFDVVCQAFITGQYPKDQLGINGTLMFAPQREKRGDCDAAVNFFKRGHRWFGSVPPVFYRFGQPPYNRFQRVGFVGLYNPKENADIDCAHFTCYNFVGDEELPRSVHRGVWCITTPPALKEGEVPLSKGQFEQIRKSIYNAQDAEGQAGERASMSILGKRN